MGNKILIYVGAGVLLLLLIGVFSMGRMSGNVVGSVSDVGGGRVVASSSGSMAGHHGGGQSVSLSSEELAKYRSEDIPADCRLPDYDNDVVGWATHMGHHAETEFCLEYYVDVIAPVVSESSSGMPDKCRQPSGRDRDSWVEHLGHHAETKECLRYFE